MKKAILLFVLMGAAMFSYAQPIFGIFAGPQVTSAKYTVRGTKQSVTSKVGFNVGAGLKVPFENRLYFSPEVFYSLKGYKVELMQSAFPPDSLAVDNDVTLHTFETAFLLQFDLSKHANHFFIKAGPSLDFQLAGHEEFHKKDGQTIDRPMKFGFGDYGHFGANILLQLGYETGGGLQVKAMYTHGIGSINNADYGPAIHHRVFGLSFGKSFTHPKKS